MPEARPRSRRSFYDVLGVHRTADIAAVKKAYRSAALRWHPDKNAGSAEAERRFKEIAEAYDVLSDPDKKRSYDQVRSHGFPGPAPRHSSQGRQRFHYPPRSPFDVFQEFFGSRDPMEDLFADFFRHSSDVDRDGFFTNQFYADENEPKAEAEKLRTFFSFTSGKPGEAAAARKTSTSTRRVDGRVLVTKKTLDGRTETIEDFEDGVLKSRTVNSLS